MTLPEWLSPECWSLIKALYAVQKSLFNWSYIIHRNALRLLSLDDITFMADVGCIDRILRLNSHFHTFGFSSQVILQHTRRRLSGKAVYRWAWGEILGRFLFWVSPHLGWDFFFFFCQLYRRGCSSDLFYYWYVTLGECRLARLRLENMLYFLARKLNTWSKL